MCIRILFCLKILMGLLTEYCQARERFASQKVGKAQSPKIVHGKLKEAPSLLHECGQWWGHF
jgi:hypothetical protein